MTPTYSISDLADQFDITPRTIRFYEDQGLLSPERNGSRRVYHERDRVRLRLILRAKRIGFTLSEIGDTLSLYDGESGESAQLHYVLEVITSRREILRQQQEDIRHVLDDMAQVEQRIRAKLRATEDNLQT
jgi:DNA-binding transcriptional MerR regulator